MMKQFFDFKAKYPEAVLLFRCGDFYETYCEDAVIASQILGITLTHRNNGYNKGDEMARTCPSWCVQASVWPSAISWKIRS